MNSQKLNKKSWAREQISPDRAFKIKEYWSRSRMPCGKCAAHATIVVWHLLWCAVNIAIKTMVVLRLFVCLVPVTLSEFLNNESHEAFVFSHVLKKYSYIHTDWIILLLLYMFVCEKVDHKHMLERTLALLTLFLKLKNHDSIFQKRSALFRIPSTIKNGRSVWHGFCIIVVVYCIDGSCRTTNVKWKQRYEWKLMDENKQAREWQQPNGSKPSGHIAHSRISLALSY